jgi:hypothetical protein
MVGKVETHVFRDEQGAHVDIMPKLARYGSPKHWGPTALHFVAYLFHGSLQPRKVPIRFVVTVLFASLLSVAPWVWGMDTIQDEKEPATATEHDSINTRRWKTYISETYGFEMKYPENLAVQQEIPLAVIEGAVLRLPLINRTYYDGTNLVEASLFVGVTPEKACSSEWLNNGPSNSSERGNLAEQRDIAGVSFSKVSSWEGAVGHQYGLITYSTLRGGSCYRLALFIHCINIHVFDPGTISEFDRATVLSLFDQVISTFRFRKPGSQLLS